MMFHSQDKAKREYKALCEELRKAQSMLQLEELGHRKRLLRRLEYADKNDIITDNVCVLVFLYYLTYLGIFNKLITTHFFHNKQYEAFLSFWGHMYF